MIVSNLHKQPTALDTVVHRDLRLDNTLSVASLLANFTSFMVTVSEFAEAAREFPILFVRAAPDDKTGAEQVAPVAVFGLKAGENVFLVDGAWTAGYLPAMLRSYPFTMARIDASDRWAMVFDASWAGFGRDASKGVPLFDADGKPSELLNNIHRFSQELESDTERTRLACARLMELKLLKPMRFDATLANGETLSVDGFMTIDEEALGKLADAQVVELFRNGLLGVIQTHQVSLGNMRRLIDRRLQRQPN